MPYDVVTLYDVVADIDNYKYFLPWCTDSRVIERYQDYLLADLTIGYGIVRETYTSKVVMERPGSITIESIKGPFSHLKSQWNFKELGERLTEVEFIIDLRIKNPILEALFNRAVDAAFRQIMASFENRVKACGSARGA